MGTIEVALVGIVGLFLAFRLFTFVDQRVDEEKTRELEDTERLDREWEEATSGDLKSISLPHMLKLRDEFFFWSAPAEWEINKFEAHEMIPGELIFSNKRVIFNYGDKLYQIPFEKICKMLDTTKVGAIHFLLDGNADAFFQTDDFTARVRFERIFATYPPDMVVVTSRHIPRRNDLYELT